MAATKRAVDLTNVKDAGQFSPKRKPAGDYLAKITQVDDHVKGEGKDKKEMWVFTVTLESDKRATYPYYCGFGDKEAWKIRNLCIAAGITVPKKKVMIDPNKLVGKSIGISLDDDEFEGKSKSVINATFPVDELSDISPGGNADDGDDSDDSDDDNEDLDLEEI